MEHESREIPFGKHIFAVRIDRLLITYGGGTRGSIKNFYYHAILRGNFLRKNCGYFEQKNTISFVK